MQDCVLLLQGSLENSPPPETADCSRSVLPAKHEAQRNVVKCVLILLLCFLSAQIVLSVAEHHSNLVPWQLVAQKTGAVLKHVRLTPDTQELDMQVRTRARA